MKIIFFSDAHGNQYAVREFFYQIDNLHYDLIVFGGDIFGYYYGQREIIELFRQRKIKLLLGNHDRYFLDIMQGKKGEGKYVEKYGKSYLNLAQRFDRSDIDFISSLNSRYDLITDGIKIIFLHGSIGNPLDGRVYPDTEIVDAGIYDGIDYVFMGHTHHKMARSLSNGTTLINPGAIGQQRDGKGCTYIVFDTESRDYVVCEVQYDISKLEDEIKKHYESPMMEERLIEVLRRRYL